MTEVELREQTSKLDLRCRGSLSLYARQVIAALLKEGTDTALSNSRIIDSANRGRKGATIVSFHEVDVRGGKKLMGVRVDDEGQPIEGEIEVTAGPGCGENFTKVILAGPLDGQEYPYKCAKCGNEGYYTAPTFDSAVEG